MQRRKAESLKRSRPAGDERKKSSPLSEELHKEMGLAIRSELGFGALTRCAALAELPIMKMRIGESEQMMAANIMKEVMLEALSHVASKEAGPRLHKLFGQTDDSGGRLAGVRERLAGDLLHVSQAQYRDRYRREDEAVLIDTLLKMGRDMQTGAAYVRIDLKRAHDNLRKLTARLNRYFAGDAHLLSVPDSVPRAFSRGEYEATPEEVAQAAIIAKELHLLGRTNDDLAVLDGEQTWQDPLSLFYRKTSYAMLQARRRLAGSRSANWPQWLTAGAVVVAPSERVLVVLERSDAAHDEYKRSFSIFGGGANASLDARDGYLDLERTAIRESFEESNIRVEGETDRWPMILTEEFPLRSIQCVFLGFRAASLKLLGRVSEGTPKPIPFDSLEEFLYDPQLVPSSKLHILAWLIVGAPGCDKEPRFGSFNAEGLALKLLDERRP